MIQFWSMILILIMLINPVSAVGCEFFQCPILKESDSAPVGDYIRDIQSLLQSFGYYQGTVTGSFNAATSLAVRRFQADNGLTADGAVGPETWEALAGLYEKPVMAKAKNQGPKGHVSVLVDLDKLQLQILDDGRVFKTFPVAVGKRKTPSPVGEYKVIHKALNWGTGFGTRWLGLNVPWGIYGIHGTNKPGSIGSAASHGCIRMYNRHVEEIFPWISVGTRVRIIGWTPKFQGFSRPLKLKSSGQDVVILQSRLQTLGFSSDHADGRYGGMTELAVKFFEAVHMMPVDGEADKEMLQRLDTYFNE